MIAVPATTHGSRLPTALVAVLLVAAFLAPVAGAQSGPATVSFEEQTSGGTTVHVAEAHLPDGGFVALHDATLGDGKVLKSVVGASGFLPAGTHEDVRVHLSEPLTEDAELVAMPHKDTNGDRVYAFVADNGETDGPYTDGGSPVTEAAEVTVSASVNATDQPTDGGSVIVDRVEMANGGFVVIHDERLLEAKPLASVIGHSGFLEAGVHRNVRVSLTQRITQDKTIIPMPHEDSDDDASYDFVTSGGTDDPPYRNASGNAVVDTAEARPSENATATFEDQSTGGTNVYVAEVFLPEGGFVTMHDSSLAAGKTFDSVRGTSDCLGAGVHRHLLVQLDDPLSSDDTLIAMPHQDTDDDCSYDFVTSDGQDDGPYTDDDGIVTGAGNATVSASVHYHDQSSDGREIELQTVDLAEPGFVAVHTPALLAGEVTGSVVGHSDHLEAGAYDGVTVTLDRPIRASQTLIPMPHKDTDGDGTYDFVTSDGQDDGPFVGGDGRPVVDTGFTTVRSQVTLEEQSSEGTVTVASTTLHDGGFLTLHDSSLLDGAVLESVVGVSGKLGPGTHADLEIALEDVPEGEATLIAMPHRDTNANGAYDFVDSEGQDDGPYTAAGGAVVHPAAVTFPADAGEDGGSGSDDDGTDGQVGDGSQSTPAPGLGLLAAALAGAAAAARRGD